MLNLTCTYCRAPINLSDGDLARILQEAGDKHGKSAPVTCASCRRTNKIPMQRLQLAYRQAGSPPSPSPAEVSPVEGE